MTDYCVSKIHGSEYSCGNCKHPGNRGIASRFDIVPINIADICQAANAILLQFHCQTAWVGKNLIQLNLRKKYSINVVAIRRADMVSVDIDPHEKLQKEDKLIVIANTEKLAKLK